MSRLLFLLVPFVARSLAPTPRPSHLPRQLAAGSSGSTARTATARTQTAKPSRPSGRTPTFTSQDLTNLVKNELAPKPWLPPTLSFKTDFPKTVAAVDDLKDSLKKSVERIPIYRSAQSVARKARDTLVVRKGSAAPPRSQSRAPGLTSQDVAALVEGRPPTNEST